MREWTPGGEVSPVCGFLIVAQAELRECLATPEERSRGRIRAAGDSQAGQRCYCLKVHSRRRKYQTILRHFISHEEAIRIAESRNDFPADTAMAFHIVPRHHQR